jgi:hypothetical protein
MPSTRISEPTREILRKLAEESGESMQKILEKAVEMYRRQRFLAASNLAFEALSAISEAWKTEQSEREAWDMTLSDGLEEGSMRGSVITEYPHITRIPEVCGGRPTVKGTRTPI